MGERDARRTDTRTGLGDEMLRTSQHAKSASITSVMFKSVTK